MTQAIFDERSRQRISRSVKWTERQVEPAGSRARKRIVGALPIVAFAAGDIDHNDTADVELATGDSFTDPGVAGEPAETITVYNPGLKVWEGSRMIILPCRLLDSEENEWVIMRAFSATRIRGTAPAGGIAAGASGLLTSAVGLDGHYEITTATAHLKTSDVAVQASKTTWAELTWDATNGSEWHVYQADCV